jgi:transposase
VDEKTQVQALDRTQLTFGKTEKRTHDYVRHGTTNLFAALDTKTGRVIGKCRPKRRTDDFLAFMDHVVARHSDRELHVVLDNLSTHSGNDVEKWLAKHPNVTFHYTPVGSSWLNQIEIWFGILTRQAIRRGTFGSLRLLVDTINDYIESWNEDAAPFTWTATPDEIITKVRVLHQDFKKLLANNLK